jgi:hypothetical protein
MSAELERQLSALAATLAIPPAPDLAATLVLPPRRARRRLRTTRRTLTAVFAAGLLIAGTAFAVPASRHAILRVVGLSGAVIERVPTLPPATQSRLRLGMRTAINRARHAAAFTALLPPHAEAAYIDRDVPGDALSLIVGRLVLTEYRAASTPLFMKLIDPRTRARQVEVHGDPGVYLSGEVRAVFIGAGGLRVEPVRLAGNVLLWQHGPLTLRIEGARTLRQALALADELR